MPAEPLVVVYVLGVLAAAALVLVLVFLVLSHVARAAVTPPGRSTHDLESLDVEAASLRDEGLEARERQRRDGARVRPIDRPGKPPQRTAASQGAVVLTHSVTAAKKAGANAGRAGDALVRAIGKLVNRAVDEMLLGDKRVISAADGRRLLTGDEQTESLADDVQRIIVLALPVVRALARGARVVKLPWVIVASTSAAVGIAVRTGVREIQVLSSLVAYRLEQATGAPPDPFLVKKVAIDLYLHPRRKLRLSDDKLHIVRLTRKLVVGGIFGRKTEKRANRALAAAERLDSATLVASWDTARRRPAP